MDAMTGKAIWVDQNFEFGNLMVVGDKMIMLNENGELIWGDLVDTKFRETYRKKILGGLSWSVPVLVGDHIYARDAQGEVVCLKLK